ncbi:unnamed protein product [Urochloa humidicola]
MPREQGRPARGANLGEWDRRRYGEDNQGRSYQDNQRGNWREEEQRREYQARERALRETNFNQMGGPRDYSEDEVGNKRRYGEQRMEEFNNREVRDRFHTNPNLPVHERLGGGRRDAQTAGREEFNRNRENPVEGRGGLKPKEAGICFWCRQEGHHQAECTNPPFCFRCKETGHIAAKCPTTKGASLHMYGFGFPGQGFHVLKIPGLAKQQTVENMGLISIERGEATEEKVEEELKHLIDSSWKWRVKQVASKEFLAVFPNKQILTTFSKSNGINMAKHNLMARISVSNRDPRATSQLQTGWVHVYNIPDRARNVEAVTLIAELAGDVVAVDELSLLREDPIRVRLQAREIACLRGFVEIFFEGVGYDIRFVPEGGVTQKPPPSPPKKHDKYFEGADEDDLLDSDEERASKRAHTKRQDSGKEKQVREQQLGSKQSKEVKHSQQSTSRSLSMEVLVKDLVGFDPQPIAGYDPITDKFFRMEAQREEEALTNASKERGGIAQKGPTPQPSNKMLTYYEEEHKCLDRNDWPLLKDQFELDNTMDNFIPSQDMLGVGEVEEGGELGGDLQGDISYHADEKGSELIIHTQRRQNAEKAVTETERGSHKTPDKGGGQGADIGVVSMISSQDLMVTTDREEIGAEEEGVHDVEDIEDNDDGQITSQEDGTWEVAQSAKLKGSKRKFFPAVAARKSSRGVKRPTTAAKQGVALQMDEEMEGLA